MPRLYQEVPLLPLQLGRLPFQGSLQELLFLQLLLPTLVPPLREVSTLLLSPDPDRVDLPYISEGVETWSGAVSAKVDDHLLTQLLDVNEVTSRPRTKW